MWKHPSLQVAGSVVSGPSLCERAVAEGVAQRSRAGRAECSWAGRGAGAGGPSSLGRWPPTGSLHPLGGTLELGGCFHSRLLNLLVRSCLEILQDLSEKEERGRPQADED
jgi:hypothetical protein